MYWLRNSVHFWSIILCVFIPYPLAKCWKHLELGNWICFLCKAWQSFAFSLIHATVVHMHHSYSNITVFSDQTLPSLTYLGCAYPSDPAGDLQFHCNPSRHFLPQNRFLICPVLLCFLDNSSWIHFAPHSEARHTAFIISGSKFAA